MRNISTHKFKSNIQTIIHRSCIVLFVMIFSAGTLWSQESGVTWREAMLQPEEWYGSEDAQRIADNVLLYQNNNGGWLKNIDMAKN